MANKKTPQEASSLFHAIMKASVTPPKVENDKKDDPEVKKQSFRVQGWKKKPESGKEEKED